MLHMFLHGLELFGLIALVCLWSGSTTQLANAHNDLTDFVRKLAARVGQQPARARNVADYKLFENIAMLDTASANESAPKDNAAQ